MRPELRTTTVLYLDRLPYEVDCTFDSAYDEAPFLVELRTRFCYMDREQAVDLFGPTQIAYLEQEVDESFIERMRDEAADARYERDRED